MNEGLAHDLSFATALALIDVVKGRLRKDQLSFIFDQFYATCRAALDAYEIQKARLRETCTPTAN